MPSFRYLQLDVFPASPGGGNPLGVVIDARGLSEQALQRIAKWTNLVETTFVLPPDDASASYRLRIYTPHSEIPFAGHPTVGSAHAVLDTGFAHANDNQLVQQCGAGLLPIRIEGAGDTRAIMQATGAHLARRRRDGSLRAALGFANSASCHRPLWKAADAGGWPELADETACAVATQSRRDQGARARGRMHGAVFALRAPLSWSCAFSAGAGIVPSLRGERPDRRVHRNAGQWRTRARLSRQPKPPRDGPRRRAQHPHRCQWRGLPAGAHGP